MPVIKFTTDNEVADLLFKPEPIKKSLPEWYKAMDLKTERNWSSAREFIARGLKPSDIGGGVLTAKACMPLLDYMTSGYLLRSFADVAFSCQTKDNNQTTQFVAADMKQFATHPNEQLPSTGDGVRRDYIKFVNPWAIQTPPGYSCLFYQPEYFFERRFRLFPAIVDTDKYVEPVHFPGMVTQEGDFEVSAGTPLMCVFPFKREDFRSEINFGGPHPQLVRGFFRQAYKMFYRAKKVYE